MKPKYTPSLFLTSLLVMSGLTLFSGCNDDDPVPLTSNSAIQGYAQIYSNNDKGIEVTAIGPYGTETTLTNDDGYFMIAGLGNGTYDLEYTKEGYGTHKQFGIQLFGNDTINAGNIYLYERFNELSMPLLYEVKDERLLNGLSQEAIVITTSWKRDLPPARFFIGFDDKVDYTNFEYTQVGFQLIRNGESGRLFILHSFYTLPVQSGQKVYLVGYVCNSNDEGYLDPFKDQLIYPTLIEESKSNVVEFEIY